MLLQLALVAFLAVSGLVGPTAAAPPARESSVGTSVATARPAADAVPAADEVALKKIDVVVPPTEPFRATPPAGSPVVTPDGGAVVADRIVAPNRVESAVVTSAGFQTLGLTWPEGTDVANLGGQVRTRAGGTWSGWADLVPSDDAPDAGTTDASRAVRGGTDSVWIGDSDAVQLAFAASPAGGPQDLDLALVGSAPKPATAGVVGTAAAGTAIIRTAAYTTSSVQAVATAPRVISRAEWGAPAQVCAPDVASKLVGAVVHHTAGSNDYASAAEAMQQIRNDAAFHINGRGWCDIGYNFVVDKWGNIYEGRANSLTQPVIGVHTGGFNTGTVGVAMLGTYTAAPSAATQQAVAQIIGWRLGAYGVDPQGWMSYATGAGENSRFANETVVLPRVFGHRDAAYTACPGDGGYSALPAIRSMAAAGAATVAPLNALPIGTVDAVVATTTSVTVSGWTLDPDTSSPNEAHVYIDGVGVAMTANLSRPDVAAVFGKGDRHGFTHTRTLPAGDHTVCVFSIDTSGGTNTLLNCRTATVGPAASYAPPIGSLDSVIVTNTAIAVSGWTLDPDTISSNQAHVYIDGVGTALVADGSRPDVAAVYGRGDKHGFSRSFPATPGSHEVCVFGINTALGPNTTLGCSTVFVPDAVPIGVVDSIVAAPGSLTFSGWTLDPDTISSNEVHIYIDGVGVALSANQSRPDVAAVFGDGDKHGFSYTKAVAPGLRNMCVYGINTSQGPNTLLTCRSVVVP